jgi:5-methylcytosine-specific restriction endonuclease McrA
MKTKSSLKNKHLYAFCKKIIGTGHVQNVSLFELCCISLKKLNIEKPDDISCRQFVKKNKTLIINHVDGFIAKKNVNTTSRYIPDVIKQITKTPYSHKLLGKKQYSDFYKTNEWRQLRYLALKNSCASCQCCGKKSSKDTVIHVDHIKPRSRYPELELCLDNLQVLCDDCNIGKGDWDETSWHI